MTLYSVRMEKTGFWSEVRSVLGMTLLVSVFVALLFLSCAKDFAFVKYLGS